MAMLTTHLSRLKIAEQDKSVSGIGLRARFQRCLVSSQISHDRLLSIVPQVLRIRFPLGDERNEVSIVQIIHATVFLNHRFRYENISKLVNSSDETIDTQGRANLRVIVCTYDRAETLNKPGSLGTS